MRTLRNFAARSNGLLFISALLSAVVCVPAVAATTYKLEFAPVLSGYWYPVANGINVNGTVVGTAQFGGDTDGTTAAQWDASGQITNITPNNPDSHYGRAVAINNVGQVLVVENSIIYVTGNGTRVPIQTGLNQPSVLSMNDAGSITGYFQVTVNNATQYRAFVFANGVATDLGTLPAGGDSAARDINNLGHIAGSAYDANHQIRATVWRDGVITNLGTLPGDTESVAYAINDNGQIVGTSKGSGGTRGFVWQNGVMTDMGRFPNSNYIRPYGINNAGKIVGYTQPTGSTFERSSAFAWNNGVFQDLNPLVARTGVYGCMARTVSDAGHIAGDCIYDMFRLTPIADGVDVGIEMLSTPATYARQGEPLVYTLRVANTGSLPATGIAVTNILPVSVTYVSAVSTQGACSGTTTVNCAIGNLAPGADATVTLTVIPTQVIFSMPNTATVSANETDANPQNNSATISVWVQAAIIYTDMSVKIVGPATGRTRTNFTYTVTVKNDGPGTAPYTTVTNNVAANLYFISSSTTNGSCGGVSCTIGTLAAGETATITLVLRPLSRGTYTSKSSLTFGTTDKNLANNSATITTVVK